MSLGSSLPLSDKTAGFINTSLAMGVASVLLIAGSHIMWAQPRGRKGDLIRAPFHSITKVLLSSSG